MVSFPQTRRDFLASAAAASVAAPLLAREAAGQSLVKIDLGAPTRRMPSLSGFLHGIDEQTPQLRVKALAPAYWRSGGTYGLKILPRILAAGATPIIVLSDGWGYPATRRNWRPPYDDLPAWKQMVAETIRKVRAAGAPANTVYDVWNEPDGRDFWLGSAEQYLSTFQAAHDVVRALAPAARISGPSIAGFDRARIEAFVRACAGRSLRVDILSWHEFRRAERLASMAADIAEMKQRLVSTRTIGLSSIHINEYGPERGQHEPGMAAAYLFHMERGGAEGAARACWGLDGASSCWDGSVGSCLTPNGLATTGIGRVYSVYSATTAARFPSRSDDGALAHFAGRDGQGGVVALIARAPSLLTAAKPVTLAIGNQQGRGQIEVIDLAPSRNVEGTKRIVRVERDGSSFDLGPLAPGAAMAVQLG